MIDRMELEVMVGELARALRALLPPGVGFTLLLFDFGAEGFFSYASNAKRSDIVKFLEEARAKIAAAGE